MAYSDRLARVVGELLKGQDYKEVAARVNVDETTILNMLKGRIVRRRTLDQFSEKMRLPTGDRQRLYRAAGYVYEPGEDEDPPFNPAQAFLDGLRAIEQEHGETLMFSPEEAPLATATVEDVEAALAAIRARVRRLRGGGSPGGAMLLCAR